MKRFVLAGCLLLITGIGWAGSADFKSAQEVVAVSVTNSSFTWTRIPAAGGWVDKQRTAIRIDLDPSCTDYLFISESMDADNGPNYPGAFKAGQTTTEGLKYRETDGPWTFSIPHNVYLWMNVQGDGSETIYYQQKR